MAGYDFDRPFADVATMSEYCAVDPVIAVQFGKTVRAMEMSNSEYATRYNRLSALATMKEPPSHNRKFSDYLVVRKLGTASQYETWMPEEVFCDLYRPIGPA